MKTRRVVSILILVFAVLIVVSSATGKKAQMSEKDLFKKLSGTWVNKDYDAFDTFKLSGKVILRKDGTYHGYSVSDDLKHSITGEYKTIEDIWTDTEGNIWYKATIEENWTTTVMYVLGKIDSSGSVWEFVWSGVDFPPEIDSNHGNYLIYYRQ